MSREDFKSSGKIGDMYLNMVFPFCVIYMCILFSKALWSKGMSTVDVFDMVLLVLLILGFLYGVLAIIKELKVHGKLDTLIYWINKIKKSNNKDEDSTREDISER